MLNNFSVKVVMIKTFNIFKLINNYIHLHISKKNMLEELQNNKVFSYFINVWDTNRIEKEYEIILFYYSWFIGIHSSHTDSFRTYTVHTQI